MLNPPIGITVYINSISAQLGVLTPVLPQNEGFKMPQNEVYRIILPQIEVNRSVLSQNGVSIVNCPIKLKLLWIIC